MGVHNKNAYDDVRDLLDIPLDEPLFIIRGQDDLSMAIITRYKNLAREIEDPTIKPTDEWFHSMDQVIGEFAAYRADNADKIKVPD